MLRRLNLPMALDSSLVRPSLISSLPTIALTASRLGPLRTCLLSTYGRLAVPCETMLNVANSATRLSEHSQVPEYEPNPEITRSFTPTPIYHIEPVSQPAEAVILESAPSSSSSAIPNENRLQIWLRGLDPQRLEAFDKGAIFSIIDRQSGQALSEIQQIDGTRRGLQTQARLVITLAAQSLLTLADNFCKKEHAASQSGLSSKLLWMILLRLPSNKPQKMLSVVRSTLKWSLPVRAGCPCSARALYRRNRCLPDQQSISK